MKSKFPFALLVLLFTSLGYAAEDEIVLSPVVVDGTAGDALKFDALSPSTSGKSTQNASNGGIAHDISNQFPYHLSDNSRPGNVVTLSGNTRTAEEFDVNVLGVPLNAPQGGGYNLSSFPQFLWSGFNFQVGPSMGAYDPRAVAGSLSLKLWTQEAIATEGREVRATGFYSSSKVQQISAGVDTGKQAAINVGNSFGEVEGQSGSISARVFENGKFKTKFHLIATNQKIKNFLSERSKLPTADYTTMRVIPILQMDTEIQSRLILKSTFFWDHTYLKTDDPTNPDREATKHERSHIRQGGVETALIMGDTKLGIGARQVDFKRLAFDAPDEKLLNLQLTHTIRSGDFTVEPTVGGTAVTRFGLKPMATLGFRHETKTDHETSGRFLRFGYHNRFPSLLDRYYFVSAGPGVPFVIPNPDLAVERVFSTELGADFKNDRVNTSLTGFVRYSKDTRYYLPIVMTPNGRAAISSGQVINYGDSDIFGAIHNFDFQLGSMISLGTKVNWTKAYYRTAHQKFLYQPEWVGLASVDFHDPLQKMGLQISQKAVSSFLSGSESRGTTNRLPGYYYIDVTARIQLVKGLMLSAGVENILDRQIQFREAQPTEGRFYVVSAAGSF